MATVINVDVVAKPFLKWAGGKSRLISSMLPYFPLKYNYYFEPFLGGGALFFSGTVKRSGAILSDLNGELINAYRVVRDSPEELIEQLDLMQSQHSEVYYYTIRSRKFVEPLNQAARFIYLNKTCFNGIYRENSRGEFNVPMGSYKNPLICDQKTILEASKALFGVALFHSSFMDISGVESGDFVYFDPPYLPINKTSNFTGYTAHGFTIEDQIKLRDLAVALANSGVYVMLSNSDTPIVRKMYEGFNLMELQAARSVNSKGEKRGKVSELLITTY
jgi:DNA adenine methylase